MLNKQFYTFFVLFILCCWFQKHILFNLSNPTTIIQETFSTNKLCHKDIFCLNIKMVIKVLSCQPKVTVM